MKPSIDEVIKKYGSCIYAAAFNVCRCREDAEDALQDTLIRFFSAKKDYHDEEHLKAWLLRVAINRAKDLRSSFWRRSKISWDEYPAELTFEDPSDRSLFEAVMELPEMYRVTLHLYYYEEYSLREIAGILGITEGAVKSRLSRGRNTLKKKLSEDWEDE